MASAHLPAMRRSAQHGLTVLELLVAGLLTTLLLIATYNLLGASWRSYTNIVWQNKVNQEARQALDEICDVVRMSGSNVDLTIPVHSAQPQVQSGSDLTHLGFTPSDGNSFSWFTVSRQTGTGTWYLVDGNQFGGGNAARAVAQFVNRVQFEYEYRLPSDTSDTLWHMTRTTTLPNNALYLVRTVYVTVTASVSPDGPSGPTLERTLTSAVHLRTPYGTFAPPAMPYP